MAGYSRVNRHVFDGVTTGADPTSAAADETLGARFTLSAWGNDAALVNVFSSPKKGVRTNTVTAKGTLLLAGQGTTKLRVCATVALGSGIASNTGISRTGVMVAATNTVGGRGVFCGLSIDAAGANRRWLIAVSDATGVLTELATLASTIGTTSTTNQRPIRVELDGNALSLHTVDGVLTADLTGQASLGDYYGIRLVGGGGTVSDTKTPFVTAFDALIYDSAFTPPNRPYDRTSKLPGYTPVRFFGVGTDYQASGATATYDPTDYLEANGAAQTLVQQGVGTNRLDLTFLTPLDLTNKCLAVAAKFDAPDQLQYITKHLAANVTFDGTPQTITLDSTTSLLTTGSFDIGSTPGHVVYYTGKSGNTLTGCTLDKTGSISVMRSGVGTDTGSYVIGDRAAAHASQISGSGTLDVRIATDATAHTAGNYVLLKPLSVQHVGWMLSTFIVKGNLDYNSGWEGRVFGTGLNLNSVGFIRLVFTPGNTLPLTTPPNDGAQAATSGPTVKWDSIGTFTKVDAPAVAFTFDDAHDTDWSIAADELQKPRPGFPNGMRGTFHVIDTNIDTAGSPTRDQYQRLSAAGHEVAMHCDVQAFHADEQDSIPGHGPYAHAEAIRPGSAIADSQRQMAYFASLGIPGPYTFAWPHGQGAGAAYTDWGVLNGLAAHRSLSGGGPVEVSVSNVATLDAQGRVPSLDLASLTTRFLTNPPGDVTHIPGVSWSKDLKGRTDNLGQRFVMRMVLDACQQGGRVCFVTHQMYETGVTPLFSGSWNRDMFAEALNYISDLKQGTNVTGFNPELVRYANLTVGTLSELVNPSTPQARAVPEAAGAAI